MILAQEVTLNIPHLNWPVIGGAALAVAVVLWRFGYPLWLYVRRGVKRIDRPAAQDSDKRAPVGAHQWMAEVLAVLGDCPADLKLQILTDEQTTVALALQKYNSHLRGGSKP